VNNSANSLLLILEDCRSQNKQRTCADTWRQVLDVPSNTQLIGALGQFLCLAESAGKEVLAVHGDESGVDYWKSKIFSGLHSTKLSEPWVGFIHHIDDVTMFTLRSHAALIDSKRPLGEIKEEDFDAINTLLEQAKSLLLQVQLPDDIKVIILARIEQLQSLILRHRFVSPSSVIDAAKVLAAELSAVAKEHPDSVRSSKFYETMKEGLEILANATQVASSTPLMVGTTTYLLGLIS
jgi:hypothetical protein